MPEYHTNPPSAFFRKGFTVVTFSRAEVLDLLTALVEKDNPDTALPPLANIELIAEITPANDYAEDSQTFEGDDTLELFWKHTK